MRLLSAYCRVCFSAVDTTDTATPRVTAGMYFVYERVAVERLSPNLKLYCSWSGRGKSAVRSKLAELIIHREAEKRNQFSFVCILVPVLRRNC